MKSKISKVTFLKSVHSKKKDEACLSFLVNIFTKSIQRGGVNRGKSSEAHTVVIQSSISCQVMSKSKFEIFQ